LPSADTLHQVLYCPHNNSAMQQSTPINALRLAIFFIAAGLASASMTNMVLSEEKTAMSKNGTLSYASLSFQEKVNLFKRYEAEVDRQVTYCYHMLISYLTSDL
jgi:hypothetical protein